MEDIQLLIDLHKDRDRQGPGSRAATERALELALDACPGPSKVVDIGCGTGASTLVLASLLEAQITALDFIPAFLDVLEYRSQQSGCKDRITTLACSMDRLPFEEGAFDMIWSEGAVYNIGFANGVREWRRFLKPGGALVLSEITWITGSRPQAVQEYWQAVYPEIDTASAKMAQLEEHGYTPVGYFVLPGACWLDHYYRPLQASFPGFLQRNDHAREAQEIVVAEQHEIDMYQKYGAYYSYGFYIARKI